MTTTPLRRTCSHQARSWDRRLATQGDQAGWFDLVSRQFECYPCHLKIHSHQRRLGINDTFDQIAVFTDSDKALTQRFILLIINSIRSRFLLVIRFNRILNAHSLDEIILKRHTQQSDQWEEVIFMLSIDIFTLFPAMFTGPLTESILKRAQENGLLKIDIHDIRDYANDKHHITDEPPYGGGGGMIMKVRPLVEAIEDVLQDAHTTDRAEKIPVILTTPQGRVFSQAIAKDLAQYTRLVFICGRYEGIDERVRQLVVTDEMSIGDYVLTGGELPTMVMLDAIARHIPGVLGEEGAADDDSHATGLLESAHYTRPPVYRDLAVPAPLLSGDHAGIARWRREDAIRRTWERRPDMLLAADLTDKEKYFLAEIAEQWINNHVAKST